MTGRWAIAGGGMLGLTMALRLAEAGEAVDVVEAQPQLGGLASGWQIGPLRWDRFYHVILASDTHTRQLLTELQLEGHLQWRRAQTGFYARGRIYPLNSPADFIRFPILNPWEKARLGLTMILAPRAAGGEALEEVTAADWVRGWSGTGVVEKFWLPLLKSKLGAQAESVSASFLHATMVRLGSARKLGAGRDQFGYLPGGYGRIVEALTTGLAGLGVNVRTATDVRAVRNEYERIVVTVPGPTAVRLGSEFSAFDAVPYLGVVCPSFVLDRPLSTYYVTNLGEGGLPFTGVIDMTALVDPAEFGGRGLVYLPQYAGHGDAIWELPDADVIERAWEGLRVIYPHLSNASRVAAQVARARHVFPVPTPGHSRRVPAMRTATPGVYAVNATHIRNGTLNVNETVQLANRTAEWLLAGAP